MAEQLIKKFTIQIDGIDKSIESVDDLKKAIDALNKSFGNTAKEQKAASQATKDTAEKVEGSLNKQAKAAESAGTSFDKFYKKFQETPIEELSSLVDEAEKLARSFDDLNPATGTIGAINQQIEELGENLNGLDPATDAARNLSTEIQTLEKQLELLAKQSEAAIGQDLINQLVEAEKRIEAANKVAEANVDEGIIRTIVEADEKIAEVQARAKAGLFPKGSIRAIESELEALNAKIPKTAEEAEAVQRQIIELERELSRVQLTAEKGIFPPNSIGAAEKQAELLQQRLQGLVRGTTEYNKVKLQLEEINRELEVSSLTIEDQRNLYFDLGASVASSFAGGVGLVQSFAGENEDVNRILAITQQTLAAIETIRSLADTAQLTRRVAIIKSTQNQIKATNKATDALNNEADAARNAAAAQDDLAGSTKDATQQTENLGQKAEDTGKKSKGAAGGVGFIGNAFKNLGAIIKANPILALASVLLAIGTALVALRSKIKPVDEALKFIEDTTGGITEAFTGLLSSGDQILNFLTEVGNIFIQYLNPIGAVINAFEFLREGIAGEGFGKAINDIKADFDGLTGSAEALGLNFGNNFNKGFDKAAEARRIKEAQAQADFLKDAQATAAARLATEQRFAAQAAALQQEQLKKDSELAQSRLKNQLELTDAEVEIIKQGDAQAVESLRQTLKTKGKLNEDNLALLNDFAQKEIELLNAVATEQNRLLDEALARRNAQRALRQQELSDDIDFNSKIEAERINLEQALDGIRVRRAKGEVVFAEEEQRIRLQSAQAIEAIEKQRAETVSQIISDTQKLEQDAELARLNLIDELTETELEKRQSGADRITALEARIEQDRQDLLTAARIETANKLAELEADRREAEAQLGTLDENTIRAFEQRKTLIAQEANARRIEITKEAQQRASEIQTQILTEEREARQAALDKEIEFRKLISEAIEQDLTAFQAIAEDVTKSLVEREDAARTALEARIRLIKEATELELRQLGLTETQLKVLQDEGVEGLTEKFQDLDKTVIQTAANIQQRTTQAIETATKEGEALIDQIKNRSELDTLLAGLLGTDNQNVIDGFKQAVSTAIDVGTQAAQAFSQLLTQLGDNQVAELDKQLEASNARFDEQAERNTELLEQQTTQIEESNSRISELEAALTEQRVDNRDAVIRAIERERVNERKLAQDKIRLEKEQAEIAKQRALQEYEIEKQKAEIQRATAKREKALAIANAAIQTAVAITRTLAEVPKVDFGVTTGILIGAYAAIGAAQIAAISAQALPTIPDPPPPQFASGGFTPRANSDSKPVGIVHANEYVVPAKLLRRPDTRAMVDRLESVRSRGFQEGGFTSATTASNEAEKQTAFITSSLQKQNDTLTALASNLLAFAERPSVVTVSSIDAAQNEVNDVEARTTI